jgi:hypothetical protein
LGVASHADPRRAITAIVVVLIAGLIVIGLACRRHGGGDRALELSYLRAAVAPAVLDYAQIEVPGIEHIRLAEVDCQPCLGLRVFHGQRLKNNGVRAELSIDFPYRVGDTVRYQWRFFVPTDFQGDAPAGTWWVFADWHDQPDRDHGETWDGFPSRSAPVILGYGRLDGRDLLGFTYGSPDPKPVATVPFTRGAWHRVTALIAWSRGADGRAEISLDGAPAFSATGPNMHNAFQHYAKIGMYRHPDIAGDDWIYLAGVDIATVVAGAP